MRQSLMRRCRLCQRECDSEVPRRHAAPPAHPSHAHPRSLQPAVPSRGAQREAATRCATRQHTGKQSDTWVHPAALSVVHPTARAACCPLPRVSLGSRCNPPRRGGHARRATHPSASAPPVGSPMVERRAPMLACSQPASQPRVALRPQRGGGSGSVCAGGGQCRRCWCRGRRGATRRCGGVHTLMTRAVLLSRVHVKMRALGATGAAAALPADGITGIAPFLAVFFVWGPLICAAS